jgi:phage/plasmid-associated DNA primase
VVLKNRLVLVLYTYYKVTEVIRVMDSRLRDLLRRTAGEGTAKSATHATSYGPTARWVIPASNHEAFWREYCELAYTTMNGSGDVQSEPLADLCLAECPQECMPLVTKLTFKFHADDNEHDDPSWEPYDNDFLHWVVHLYQVVIAESVVLTSGNFIELVSVVLESESHWYEEDRETGKRYIVMEVRIHFPYAHIDASVQSRVIRPKVIQMLRNTNVMSKLQRAPIGDWDQIVSSTIANEPIPMYGSSDVKGRPKLKLAHIWSGIPRDDLDNGLIPPSNTLDDVFLPKNHSQVQNRTVGDHLFEDNPDLEFWLPMFISTGYWMGVLLPIPNNDTQHYGGPAKPERSTESQRIFGTPTTTPNRNRNEDIESEMELAERLIPMINNMRFLQEPFWIDIGRTLYVSDEGGDNGLLAWIRHTERATAATPNLPEYMTTSGSIADTCRDLYQTFANSPLTNKTLAWYAREDAPERFSSWHRDWCMTSMEQALTCYHTDVAVALYRVYWLDFMYCSSIGKGRWYQYRNHRWTEISQGIALRKVISRDFMKRFEAIRTQLSRQIQDSHDDSFKANGEITLKKITQLIGRLKSQPFKGSIVAEASEHFNNDRFASLLDMNSDITGYTNGVVEVVTGKAIFRRGKPEDFVSMCTNIPFPVNMTWDHPLVKEVMKWISQVFPDENLLHHFLKFSASCLKGRNSDKIFPIWTGSGDNSKSMIVKLFEASLGSYCIKLPVILLSEKGGSSSGPTPQLARAKATRVAFLDEPEDDVPIHKGTIKRYTGGDSFFARMLQENGGDVQATFKMILMCNRVPIIPNADRAIKGRTRLFPFLSTWEDNPPETEEEQMRQRRFKKNTTFDKRIPIMAPAFAWIKAQYYPYYATEGLPDPAIVTETTDAYWRDNDVYAQFAADSIQEVYTVDSERDPNARCTLSEIYSEFKIWFRDAFPGTKVPERQVVRTELTSRWGRMVGTSWHGIRIATDGAPADLSANLGARKPPYNNSSSNTNIPNTNIHNSNIPKAASTATNMNIIAKAPLPPIMPSMIKHPSPTIKVVIPPPSNLAHTSPKSGVTIPSPKIFVVNLKLSPKSDYALASPTYSTAQVKQNTQTAPPGTIAI